MHEFSIAQSICEIAIDEAKRHQAVHVRTVKCRIGAMRGIVPEMLQTAFELLREDCGVDGASVLSGAELLTEIEGVEVHCLDCDSRITTCELPFQCSSCGSVQIKCDGGDEISLMSMDIDKEVEDGDPSPATS